MNGERRLEPDIIVFVKPGNRRFVKLLAKLESENFYGRVSFVMKSGETVGTVDTSQTHRLEETPAA